MFSSPLKALSHPAELVRLDTLHFCILRPIFGVKSSYYHRLLKGDLDPCSSEYLQLLANSYGRYAYAPSQLRSTAGLSSLVMPSTIKTVLNIFVASPHPMLIAYRRSSFPSPPPPTNLYSAYYHSSPLSCQSLPSSWCLLDQTTLQSIVQSSHVQPRVPDGNSSLVNFLFPQRNHAVHSSLLVFRW